MINSTLFSQIPFSGLLLGRTPDPCTDARVALTNSELLEKVPLVEIIMNMPDDAFQTPDLSVQGQDHINRVLDIERKRFELLRDIEKARMDLHHSFLELRMELLAKNKEHVEWLLDAMSELRKERVAFQKKSIPEIAEALIDGKVSEKQIGEWLSEVTKLYHADLSTAQQLVAVDVAELDNGLFDTLKKTFEERIRRAVETMEPSAQPRKKENERAQPQPQSAEQE